MTKFLDFKFIKENYIAVLALIFSIIFVKVFNLESVAENSVLENTQLLALFFGFIASLKAKDNKVFFVFISMVLFLMFMREISYGRAIFAQVPNGEAGELYPWSHFKYGYLAHIIVGIYIVICSLYALINKIWVDAIDLIKKVKFPVWTFLMSFVCVFLQLYSEKTLHNSIVEETCELTLYCLILALVLYYSKQNAKQ